MKRYQYTCTLLSDVVISSVTATEGFNPSLDYIPGAKFLGIAAGKLYNEKSLSTLDLFHNGKVRFGDAYPQIAGQTGLPVPFSWFFEKGEGLIERPIYLHHKLGPADFGLLTRNGKQLQQARKGYFNLNSGKYFIIDQEFAIRSAYDRTELRAMDSQMFGYFSLPQGSHWTFTVDVDPDAEQYAESIRTALVGKKRIGRSRSAEYGLVEIKFDQELSLESKIIPASELTLIYALSNLCFYDSFGRPTVKPSSAQLGISEGEIIWEKSQIRTRLYQTWNRTRYNRDADRMIIEKGSVIAIRHSDHLDGQIFASGIGSHKAEGFGQVLINPVFLLSEGIKSSLVLTRIGKEPDTTTSEGVGKLSTHDVLVLNYLGQRRAQKSDASSLSKKINEFVHKDGPLFKGITASQWGTIRAYAKHSANWSTLEQLLFDKEIGALYRGQSESDWRQNGRREKLHIFLKSIENTDRVLFILKLAAEMAKSKQAKEKV